ncbi:MAG TPA: TonB family protein [Vicinamibacterales bacterium]|nr:TonB family protein [Vicinamibacterales bacterium]
MFDYVSNKPTQESGRPRYKTAIVSGVAHVVVIGLAVGLPILYANEALPTPPDMIAFVMAAPPPPPPPPPPAPAAPEKKPTAPAKPTQPTMQVRKPIVQANPVAAPIEAPSSVRPETGLEGNVATGSAKIDAGFENNTNTGVVGGAVGGIDVGAPAPPPPPAPKPIPQGPVRVGGQIKAPQLLNKVNPAYPMAAHAAQVEGSVVLEATVNKAGRVQNVRAVRGHSLLEGAAIAAVKQWTYEPLVLNGQPTPFILTVTLNFSIPR